MTKITPQDVKKVASLARLDLQDGEIDAYTDQLEKILRYVAHLQEIDTENIPATTRAVEVTNVTRDDIAQLSPLKDKLLELSPHSEGRFFRVPKILSD